MPKSEKKGDAAEQQQQERKDPYTILGVGRNSTEQEIKSAYRKLALKYHPDKNSDDPIASDIFKEVTHSYNILSDPDKRRKYDALGYEAVELESQELEVDLSSLGTVNTMFAALFSKLGIPIRTTVSATLLEEALNGRVTIHPLNLGQSISRKVEKQCAHFYSVEITEQEAQMGFVCRVHSAEKSKFKLLYFEQEDNGGLNLSLQEDSAKIGKFTCAGMFFLCFPVYRFEHTNSYLQLEASKDPDAFFKKLDGFQPCEINELKPGTQVFAVYGDNFFKSANYTIEFVCAAHFSSEKEQLRNAEAKILTKRVELSSFEGEYRQVLAQFTEMTDRYVQSMHEIDELLDSRTGVLASFTSIPPPLKRSGSSSKIRGSFKGSKGEEEGQSREKKSRYQSKKKWYNLHSNIEKRKPC